MRRCGLLVFLLAYPVALSSTELKPVTLKAWNDYVQRAESRMRSDAEQKVLWMDREPGRRDRVRRGEIVALPVGDRSPRSVPHGLIHDWIGAVFIPKVSLNDVLAVLRDYDRHADYYGPVVHASKTLSRGDKLDSFQVRYARKALFVTVVLDAEYEAQYFRLDGQRWYSVTRSTSIRQIEHHDGPDERALPPDNGSGFLWRAYSIVQLEASDGGVYVEQESIALSTTIPAAWRWIVGPFVQRLSKSLAIGTLDHTRRAAISAAGGPSW